MRPMRPKPLMPILMVMEGTPGDENRDHAASAASAPSAATFSGVKPKCLNSTGPAPIRRRCRCRPRRRSRTSTSRRSRPSRPRCAARPPAAPLLVGRGSGGRRRWSWASRPRAPRSPSGASCSCALSASCTSEPVAMITACGLPLQADLGRLGQHVGALADLSSAPSRPDRTRLGAYGRFWRDSSSAVGRVGFCSATAQATAVSAVSQGRQTSRLGIRRRLPRARSTGASGRLRPGRWSRA